MSAVVEDKSLQLTHVTVDTIVQRYCQFGTRHNDTATRASEIASACPFDQNGACFRRCGLE